MGEDRTRKIGIVVAMREERKQLLRHRSVDAGMLGRYPLFTFHASGKTVSVIETGMGTANAADGAEALMGAGAEMLISIGYGGGVTPGLAPGDVVAATRILGYSGGAFAESVPRLVETSLPSVVPGTFITTRVVERKKNLQRVIGTTMSNVVVDMETWGVAEVAAAGGIPLLAIRGITDDETEEILLPIEEIVDEKGQVSRARIAVAILRKPYLLPHLLRLGRNAAAAGKNLSLFLDTFLGSRSAF
jgi:adenosylhomocysteine nucleosidase